MWWLSAVSSLNRSLPNCLAMLHLGKLLWHLMLDGHTSSLGLTMGLSKKGKPCKPLSAAVAALISSKTTHA